MALLQHMIILFNIKFARLHSQASVRRDSILCIIVRVSWWQSFWWVRGNACVFRFLRTNGVDIFNRIILSFWLYVLHHAFHTKHASKSRRLLNSESMFSWLLVCVEPHVLSDLNVRLTGLRAPEEIDQGGIPGCLWGCSQWGYLNGKDSLWIWVVPTPYWGPEWRHPLPGVLRRLYSPAKFLHGPYHKLGWLKVLILHLGAWHALRAGVQEILEVIYCCLGPLCPW